MLYEKVILFKRTSSQAQRGIPFDLQVLTPFDLQVLSPLDLQVLSPFDLQVSGKSDGGAEYRERVGNGDCAVAVGVAGGFRGAVRVYQQRGGAQSAERV